MHQNAATTRPACLSDNSLLTKQTAKKTKQVREFIFLRHTTLLAANLYACLALPLFHAFLDFAVPSQRLNTVFPVRTCSQSRQHKQLHTRRNFRTMSHLPGNSNKNTAYVLVRREVQKEDDSTLCLLQNVFWHQSAHKTNSMNKLRVNTFARLHVLPSPQNRNLSLLASIVPHLYSSRPASSPQPPMAILLPNCSRCRQNK